MLDSVQKLFTSKNAVLVLFLILAISLIVNTFKVIQRNYSLQQDVDLLTDEVALIEVQNQNLRFNIEYYKTDAYLEVEAKRRFNLAENGERVIFLKKDGDPKEQPPILQNSDNQNPEESDSNLDKWLIFLFGKVT